MINKERTFLACLFAVIVLHAQNGKILSKELIDLKQNSFWEKISTDGRLLPSYAHLDNLNFYNITYSSDSIPVKGYLVEPKVNGKYPLVIFNRGGNRDFSHLTTPIMIVYVSKLAAEGYVVMASQLRETLGSPGKDEFGGAEVNDVLNLTETAKELSNVDSNKIGLFGWSRGGMMTYLSLKKSDKFKTAFVGNGDSDLLLTPIERPDMEYNVFAECIPNYWENKEEELKKRSVIYWPDELSKNSSLFILCGTKDDRVNPENSRKLAKKLKELNYDFEFKEYDTDHRFSDKRDILNELLIDWFNRRLKGK